MVHKYRKIPVVIEAIKWDGCNIEEVYRFIGHRRPLYAEAWSWESYAAATATLGLKIDTLEGEMSVQVGDYIIKGVEGEFYPCKPGIFKQTYEPVNEGS